MSTLNWKWYAGSNEEEFHSGPFDSREEAIDALDGYGGFIIEAHKADIQLASYFDAVEFIENAEENGYEFSSPDGEYLFDVSTHQLLHLQEMVKDAISEWQKTHNLVFTPWAFSGTRNLERIDGEMEHP